MTLSLVSRRVLIGGTLAVPFAASTQAAAPLDRRRLDMAIAATDRLAQKLLASTGIPGLAIAIVQGQDLRFARGYGLRQVGEAGAVNADTVFQLASVSKPLGATVVAHQVGIGSVAWDSRMQSLLPWFALSDATATRELTIADLYAHRSGLPDHAGDVLEDLGYDRTEILHRLRLLPLEGFRTHYAYTNMGVTAAAEAVAVKAGVDWASLSETALYRPLGMSRTTSRFAEFMAMDNRAVGHMPVNGQFVPGPVRDPEVQSPAGGASSSAHDMAKWLSLILGQGRYQGGEIVARAGLLPAISPQMQTAPAHDGKPSSAYGFGFNVGTSDGGQPMLGHSGAFLLGAGTSIMMLPALNIGIVVLTNAWPVGVAEAISLTFLDLVQFGAAQKNWMEVVSPVFAQMRAAEGSLAGKTPPAHPAPPQALSAYAGTYDNAYYGPLIVRNVTAGLTLVAGPAQVMMPCTHWDGDVFAIHPGGENAPPGSAYKVSFTGHPPALVESDFFAQALDNRFTR
jgi:CubicO group peptidase (beta-lactamase class C family)